MQNQSTVPMVYIDYLPLYNKPVSTFHRKNTGLPVFSFFLEGDTLYCNNEEVLTSEIVSILPAYKDNTIDSTLFKSVHFGCDYDIGTADMNTMYPVSNMTVFEYATKKNLGGTTAATLVSPPLEAFYSVSLGWMTAEDTNGPAITTDLSVYSSQLPGGSQSCYSFIPVTTGESVTIPSRGPYFICYKLTLDVEGVKQWIRANMLNSGTALATLFGTVFFSFLFHLPYISKSAATLNLAITHPPKTFNSKVLKDIRFKLPRYLYSINHTPVYTVLVTPKGTTEPVLSYRSDSDSSYFTYTLDSSIVTLTIPPLDIPELFDVTEYTITVITDNGTIGQIL